MKSISLVVLLTLFSLCAHAQDLQTSPRAQTTVPDTARYEIVQSPIMVKWTFRLDKYTGRVWQLVKTKDDDYAWESMPVVGLPKSPIDFKVRYQIFASGIVVRSTFLLNVETGKTWVLTSFKNEGKEDTPGWSPFID